MHKIAVLAFDGVVSFDLTIPCGVFAYTRLPSGKNAYEIKVCGMRKTVKTELFDFRLHHGIEELLRADTIVIPGMIDVSVPIHGKILAVLAEASRRKIRIASICSGAFILAQAGLLDGREATTHWMAVGELKNRFPLIRVNPNVLYVESGHVFTSAGAAAGLDLCLHLVRLDFGAGVAAESARVSVMPLERVGGQAQFIIHAPPTTESESLGPILHWLDKNCHKPLMLSDISNKARMSPRTLSRKFAEQTGTTPLQQVFHFRICRGQELLESTRLSVDLIAEKVGFGTATSFRTHFRKYVGTSPQRYREAFKSNAKTKVDNS